MGTIADRLKKVTEESRKKNSTNTSDSSDNSPLLMLDHPRLEQELPNDENRQSIEDEEIKEEIRREEIAMANETSIAGKMVHAKEINRLKNLLNNTLEHKRRRPPLER